MITPPAYLSPSSIGTYRQCPQKFKLGRIDRTVGPDQCYLVVDAMTGQDAVRSAKAFNDRLQLDGVILTNAHVAAPLAPGRGVRQGTPILADVDPDYVTVWVTTTPDDPAQRKYLTWHQERLFAVWDALDKEVRAIRPKASFIANSGGGALSELDMNGIGKRAATRFEIERVRIAVALPHATDRKSVV